MIKRYKVEELTSDALDDDALLPAAVGPGSPRPDIRVDETAAPSFEEMLMLFAIDSRVRQSWEHQRGDDLHDQSTSGYDMSLASFAAAAGWEDQKIVDLLVAHRRKWGADLKRPDYYERTVAAVRQERAFDPAAGSPLTIYNSDPPRYEVTQFGHVIGMTPSELCSVKRYRDRVFNVARRWPPRMSQKAHEELVERWAKDARVVNLEGASEQQAKLYAVWSVLALRMGVLDDDALDEWTGGPPDGVVFGRGATLSDVWLFKRGGTIYVHAPSVRALVNGGGDLRLDAGEIAAALRRLGFEDSKPVKIGGRVYRLWPRPGEWPPAEPGLEGMTGDI